MNSLAPILIPTYRRLTHVRRSIEALKENELAKESILYLTSDGPMPGHEEQVDAVREYLKTVDGFKDIILLFREHNDRIQNWNILTDISNQCGKLIYLEEDCETAPGFLPFINEALERFEHDQTIFSVHGYTPPLPSLRNKPDCLMLLPHFNAWGFGIWKNRNLKIQPQMTREQYLQALRSWKFNSTLLRRVGVNVVSMYKEITAGNLLAYDAMAIYAMIKGNYQSVYPTRSFVRNFGFDGTGEHCGEDSSCDVELAGRYCTTNYSNDPAEFNDVVRDSSRFWSGGRKRKFKYLSRRLRGRYRLKSTKGRS